MFDARNNLGSILNKKGRYREAVAQLQEALKLSPGNQLAQNNLAFALSRIALVKQGDWQTLYNQGLEAAGRGASR